MAAEACSAMLCCLSVYHWYKQIMRIPFPNKTNASKVPTIYQKSETIKGIAHAHLNQIVLIAALPFCPPLESYLAAT
eukprot:6377918-Amphidinium_carterae.1